MYGSVESQLINFLNPKPSDLSQVLCPLVFVNSSIIIASNNIKIQHASNTQKRLVLFSTLLLENVFQVPNHI